MPRIGLTGGIGSGKTAVAAIFNILGIPVFDADNEAKRIMETDMQLVSEIQKKFGEESYLLGKLNRSFLAQIVFHDPYKLELLNALVHPATISAAEKWMKDKTPPM